MSHSRKTAAFIALALALALAPASAAVAAPPASWSVPISASCPPGPTPCAVERSSLVSVGRLGPHGEAITNGRVELAITVPSAQCANANAFLRAEYKGGARLSPREEPYVPLDLTQPGTTKVVSDAWFSGPWQMTVGVDGSLHQDPAICPGNSGSVGFSVVVSVRSLPAAGARALTAAGPGGVAAEAGLAVGDRIT